jgi:Fe-S cluster assembly protein SufD
MTLDTMRVTQLSPFKKQFEGAYQGQKARAWQRFLEEDISQNREEHQYIRLDSLLNGELVKSTESGFDEQVVKKAIEKARLSEIESYFVFVDGYYAPELSCKALDKSIVMLPLSQAEKNYGVLLQNRANKLLKDEEEPFSLLNMAAHTDGLFFYIPPKMKTATAVQVIHVMTKENSWMMPRLSFFLSHEQEAKLVESYVFLTEHNFLYNAALDVQLEERAHFHHTLFFHEEKVPRDDNKERKEKAVHGLCCPGWCCQSIRVEAKRSSSFTSVQINSGKVTFKTHAKAQLVGENAEVQFSGLNMLKNRDEAHVTVAVEHRAPHTRSEQLFKNVLFEKSVASFQGTIFVEKEAQKTDAYQLNNTLLLSSDAVTNSKPNLEIFADDVKASHGATVGQLNQEELFYLKARGIMQEDAQKELIQGFCAEVLTKLQFADLQEKLSSTLTF